MEPESWVRASGRHRCLGEFPHPQALSGAAGPVQWRPGADGVTSKRTLHAIMPAGRAKLADRGTGNGGPLDHRRHPLVTRARLDFLPRLLQRHSRSKTRFRDRLRRR